MIQRKAILLLLVLLAAARAGQTQELASGLDLGPPTSSSVPLWDFSKTVIPIRELKFNGMEVKVGFGTGFCLDSACRFVVANYHVATLTHLHKIKGVKVVRTYLATGPDDDGATLNTTFGTQAVLKFTLVRDLAIFELRHPLPRYHGASFSLKDPQIGEEVDIYTFPIEGTNLKRNFMRFRGKFTGEDVTGLLAFAYDLSGDKAIRPGSSGGVVVDCKTQRIIGVLSAIEIHGKPIALAVPIQSLADFVSKVDPSVGLTLFPSIRAISPESPDLYPPPTPSHLGVLQPRPEEPDEVRMLRRRAQLLANGMLNFVAVQTFAWGKGDNEPSYESAYEVRVVDGAQHFREYPDGKTESWEHGPLPPLNTAMSTGGEWSELPTLVGTDLGLKILQAQDAVVKGQQLKVFQYWAAPEDRACQFLTIVDLVFLSVKRVASVECYGEVWTDEDYNILRMSEHLRLLGTWKNYQGIVTYGWFHPKSGPAQLIPVTISNQAEFHNKIYWCRGRFTNYQMFTTQSEMKVAAN